jgi:hypothetical protein
VLKYHFQFRLQFLPEMTLRKAEINRITARRISSNISRILQQQQQKTSMTKGEG